ncbi:hypothetical protein SS50377_22393 [Spironucleus salmonicida]|uniref:Uncharacterized protein n=1 Tax=Spironucleus salmonicida TaxID=348837 RepID=V6LCB3_9EUKA|nr:hypothetical protein SS50377_22393 [Spironucleus salmonicida]|eukprot:EST42112.1 Hypothetical protein SS50377_18421 [Spironucleus salmonicida]
MADDFEFDAVEINNIENAQSTQVESIPRQGPYTIQLKDMSFNEADLKLLIKSLNLPELDIRTKVYEPKTGGIFYTYYIEVTEYEQAVSLVSTNNLKYKDCLLNTRYLPPRTDQKPRYERKEFSFNRAEMGQQSQVVQQQEQQSFNQFNRADMGTNQPLQQQSLNGFSRGSMGTLKVQQQQQQQQQQQNVQKFDRSQMGIQQKPQQNNFSRNQMGQSQKKNAFEDLKRSNEQTVTLNFK